ncbi:hypothetical protein [Streptomyces sp. NPDC020983]|uniref:hypothetical protein n=1 Tax=Streptomyces sp. NPDC020983 TaxID=3365106 RepID=UPI00378E4635
MFGKLFTRGAGDRAADAPARPAGRRPKKGVHEVQGLDDARVLALTAAARAGDWAALRQAAAPFDLDRDHRVLSEIADTEGVEEWIGGAVGNEADGTEGRATALLVSGARYISWGWQARTRAAASQVSQEQWRTFRERLTVAEEQLLRAAELRPEWIAPWRRLLMSGRGMSLGRPVGEARRDAALRRDPLDLETHLEWVTQLQTRWGGEPGEALAFARDAFARAPLGQRLGCVIAFAHIEDWVEAEGTDRLDRPAVRDELREAAECSVLHPGYERRPGWQYEFNLFAMALSLAGEGPTARRVFQALDGAYTRRPWDYLPDPAAQFARYQSRA